MSLLKNAFQLADRLYNYVATSEPQAKLAGGLMAGSVGTLSVLGGPAIAAVALPVAAVAIPTLMVSMNNQISSDRARNAAPNQDGGPS